MKPHFFLVLVAACSDGASVNDDGGGGADASTSDVVVTSDAAIATLTATPAAIPASANELPNPLRGQYLWLGVPAYPSGWPDVDGYMRWNWAELEPSHGNYAWKLIDDQVAAAKTRGGRFGMRVMALCQGCGDHTYQGAQSSIPDDLAATVNPLIAAAPGDTTKYVIPDWNSTAYFTRLGELLNAIAARYHDDPHFAWVDVSSYGNWGEMHLYPFTSKGGPYETSTQQPITDANAQKLVQLNATAFANKLLVINSEQQAALAAAIASTSPPIGFRVDCLGSDGLAGGNVLDKVQGAPDHWKVAPFITEWCQYNLGTSGQNLFVQGEQQVRDYHVSMLSSGNFKAKPSTQTELDAFRTANVEAGYRYRPASIAIALAPDAQHVTVTSSWADDNVAPTYLAWSVVIGFHQGANVVVEAPLSIDLRKVLPRRTIERHGDDRAAERAAAGDLRRLRPRRRRAEGLAADEPRDRRARRVGRVPARQDRVLRYPAVVIGHVSRGRGSGILFLHGFGLDARAWEPQLAALEEQHRSIAVDLPGFGPSPVAAPGISAAAAALAVLDALEIDRVHVVGHSLGGAVAADFALAFPHRVRTLVLVDALMRGRDPKIAAWSRCVELARANQLAEALEAFTSDPLFGAAAKNEKLRAIVKDYRGAHWRGEMSTAFERKDAPAADVLAQIVVPALVMVGEHDLPSFHAMADEYAGTLRKARKVVVPNAGHVPNLEAPDAFNALLTEHFGA